jgi:predicted HicB family RNase H-like nuclease
MRERKLNLRLTEEEHAKLHALAEDEERSANAVMRRLVRDRYEARFGATESKTKKRTKGGK